MEAREQLSQPFAVSMAGQDNLPALRGDAFPLSGVIQVVAHLLPHLAGIACDDQVPAVLEEGERVKVLMSN